MWKDRRGFSLIEIIITIALMGILTGSAVVMFGHIRYADTKKAAEQVDIALSSLRLQTMSQMWDERPYLYIYRLSDGYYMKVLNKNPDAVDYNNDLKKSEKEKDDPADLVVIPGTKLCGTNVTISASPGGTLNIGSGFMWVAYTKSGLFYEDGGRAAAIEISGNISYTISLDGVSGRHYFK